MSRIETEGLVVARAGDRGNGEELLQRYGPIPWGDHYQEQDSGNDCTTFWTFTVALNCTSRWLRWQISYVYYAPKKEKRILPASESWVLKTTLTSKPAYPPPPLPVSQYHVFPTCSILATLSAPVFLPLISYYCFPGSLQPFRAGLTPCANETLKKLA